MSKIEGSIYCKDCGSKIKWCYLIPQHISGTRILQAETVPEDRILLKKDPMKNKVRIHCRNCDYFNEIGEGDERK